MFDTDDDEEIDYINCLDCNQPIEANDEKAKLRHKRICKAQKLNCESKEEKFKTNGIYNITNTNHINNTRLRNYHEETTNKAKTDEITLSTNIVFVQTNGNHDYDKTTEDLQCKNEIDDFDDMNFLLSVCTFSDITIINKEMFKIPLIYPDLNQVEEADLSNLGIKAVLNKKHVNFEELDSLQTFKLSFNQIKNLSFISCIVNLKELHLNNNLVESLMPLEGLINLEILNLANNKISIITSLAKTRRLRVLDISNNNITYCTSSMKIIKELKSLKDLAVFGNPFVNDINQYKYVFINKYKQLEILDYKQIIDVDVDLAKQYICESDFNNTWHNKSFLKNDESEIKIEEVPINCLSGNALSKDFSEKEKIKDKENSTNDISDKEIKSGSKSFFPNKKAEERLNEVKQIKVKGSVIDKIEFKPNRNEAAKLNGNFGNSSKTKSIASKLIVKTTDSSSSIKLINELKEKLRKLEETSKNYQLKAEGFEIQLENILVMNGQLEQENMDLKQQLNNKANSIIPPVIQNSEKYLKREV